MAGERSDLPVREPESATEGERTTSLLSTICCANFCFPCIGSRRPAFVGLAWWERFRAAHSQSDGQWWSRGVRVFTKIRELTEIVAGPRWKTFIRQFNRNRSAGSGGARHGKFHYDPLSYALNFEGQNSFGEDEDEDDFSRYRNFSARYAVVPPPLRPSAHRGFGKDKEVAAVHVWE